jgi:hypothetical protein
LTIGKSVWFPLGFTALYLILASILVPSIVNPFGKLAGVGLAFISSFLVWVFYCVAFLLKLRNWSRILVLIGLLAPAVIAGTFLLLSGVLWQNP